MHALIINSSTPHFLEEINVFFSNHAGELCVISLRRKKRAPSEKIIHPRGRDVITTDTYTLLSLETTLRGPALWTRSLIVFIGSSLLLDNILVNQPTIICLLDPLGSHLGSGFGKLGLLQVASSSFGWLLIIVVGLQIIWPSVHLGVVMDHNPNVSSQFV
jgi:hypothetical protein